jgi:hypothetical protein
MKQIINLGSGVGAHNGDGARTGGQKINDNFTELYGLSEMMGDEIASLEATKLAIANNLSDLDDAATARTNLGIGNIDNTSDASKPVSTAQATADATVLSSANSYTDSKVASVYKLKGSVANYAALPSSGQVVGDVWNLVDTGANYVWTGTVWDELGTTVDISAKANLASPTFTGSVVVPDATLSTQAVNKGQVDNRLVVETTSGYTLTNADSGGIIIFKTTDAQTLIIPTGLADGFECTFVTLSGVTLTVVSTGNALNNATSTTMLPQLSFTLKRMLAANTYIVAGSL